MYNFNDIQTGFIILPEVETPKVHVAFSDPKLKGFEVSVIEDSLNPKGDRLTTIVARFPRYILSEINTHRVFSRNSASSRARSVQTTFKEVFNSPFIPLFTSNQPGMSGRFLGEEEAKKATSIWLKTRDDVLANGLRLLLSEDRVDRELKGKRLDLESLNRLLEDYAEVYSNREKGGKEPNIHKQNVNRLLEPFMWHEAIVTSSYWNNFIELRDNAETAQPEIMAVAKLVKTALQESVPRKLGEEKIAHTPFVEIKENVPEEIFKAMKLSSAECAQISYKDKTRQKDKANLELAERLLKHKHYSPFEHVAIPEEFLSKVFGKSLETVFESNEPSQSTPARGNLGEGWVQFRKILDANLEIL